MSFIFKFPKYSEVSLTQEFLDEQICLPDSLSPNAFYITNSHGCVLSQRRCSFPVSQCWALLRCGLGATAVIPHDTLFVVHCSAVSNSLWPHELQHARLLCPSPNPGTCSNSCSLIRWCHPTISHPLSRLIIAFLPRSKCLLISWLQSPPALIFEPKKIVSHCFHCFPIYLLWVMGLDAMIFV